MDIATLNSYTRDSLVLMLNLLRLVANVNGGLSRDQRRLYLAIFDELDRRDFFDKRTGS